MKVNKLASASMGFLIVFFALASCNKEIKPSNLAADEPVPTKANKINPREGIIYTMSNDAGPNAILSYFQSPNGQLSYFGSTASGGNGSGAGLGSQGSLQLSANHQWLFAVNAGSNSISSFSVSEDGNLTLAQTVPSNGIMPVSLTVHDNFLYVVNAVSSNISGFTVGAGGVMTPIPGSIQPLSAMGAGPAQISFMPNGLALVVTEKVTNKITTYLVNGAGLAGPPIPAPSAGQTPFGFDFSGSNHIIVSEAWGGAVNASTVSSYLIAGNAALASGPVANNQTAACWVDVTADGKYAFVTNAGSNSISSFTISGSGQLTLADAVAETTGGSPIDIVLSDNEFYVYNLNSTSHSITEFKRGQDEKLKKIGEVTGLPAHAVGLAAF